VRPLFAFLLALSATACIDTDPTVFVDPSIEAPLATVTQGALGTNLNGSFKLKLHLGPRASGPSQVSLGSFALLDASQQKSIVSPLEVSTTAMLPVTVELDSDVFVDFTFDSGTTPLPPEAQTGLCDPAGVVLSGTIQDSLQNTSTPFASEVFKPTCM